MLTNFEHGFKWENENIADTLKFDDTLVLKIFGLITSKCFVSFGNSSNNTFLS